MAKRRFSQAEADWARRYQQDPATAGPPPSSAPTGSAQQVDPVMQTYRQQGIIPPAMIDRRAPARPDPLRGQLLGAMTGASALPAAMDTAFGGRAMRGVAAGHPREALSLIPGSDQFGLTDPAQERASHFGFVGDTLLNPGMAKLGFQLGKAGVSGIAEMLGSRAAVGGLAPEAAQFVPRPPVGRSPLGTYIERTTPGAAPRLRPKGGLPVVKPPQPGVPASLPAPPRQAQLEDLDPVKAYDRLTAGWRDPLAANVPRSVADPGRAAAHGARASKAFDKISAASNRVPDRPIPAYQSPPEAVAAHADPGRVVGSEQAATDIARRAAADTTNAINPNTPGNLAFRAMANIGGMAQRGGNYLMNAIRGGGRSAAPPDTMGAYVGFDRSKNPQLGWGEIDGGYTAGGRMAPDARATVAPGAPVASAAPQQVGTVQDLMRRGSRMYKENPPGKEFQFRGVGGPPVMKTGYLEDFGSKAAKEMRDSDAGILGFSRNGNVMRPGTAGVFQKPMTREARGIPFGETVRHERAHAILSEAMRRGPVATAQLPPVFQPVAKLKQSGQPFGQALGYLGDETLARGLEKRGLAKQVGNAANFAFDANFPGRSHYVANAAEHSPAAASLFDALPLAPRAAKGAATLAPAALLHAIRSGSEINNGGY